MRGQRKHIDTRRNQIKRKNQMKKKRYKKRYDSQSQLSKIRPGAAVPRCMLRISRSSYMLRPLLACMCSLQFEQCQLATISSS